jgi:hypothetical protein
MFAAILRLHTSRTVNEGMPQLHSLKFTKPTTNSSATTSQQAQYGLRGSNVGEHSSVPNAVGREPLGRALCASDNDLGAIVDTVAPHLGVMTNPHHVSYPPPTWTTDQCHTFQTPLLVKTGCRIGFTTLPPELLQVQPVVVLLLEGVVISWS